MNVARQIYAVRHCERLDDVNKVWYFNHHNGRDNSPLSERGKEQAAELRKAFEKVSINYCFTSPYERCVETAIAIARGKVETICVEPGLCESMDIIKIAEPNGPRFLTNKELIAKYGDIISATYLQLYLAPPKDELGKGINACADRVTSTLNQLLKRLQGEETGDILIVSHMHPLAVIQEYLTGKKECGGEATVSKYVEMPWNQGKFVAEYVYDSSHLSNMQKLNGAHYNRNAR